MKLISAKRRNPNITDDEFNKRCDVYESYHGDLHDFFVNEGTYISFYLRQSVSRTSLDRYFSETFEIYGAA